MQTILLPIGTAGLVKADLGLRYYVADALDAGDVVAALVVVGVAA